MAHGTCPSGCSVISALSLALVGCSAISTSDKEHHEEGLLTGLLLEVMVAMGFFDWQVL